MINARSNSPVLTSAVRADRRGAGFGPYLGCARVGWSAPEVVVPGVDVLL